MACVSFWNRLVISSFCNCLEIILFLCLAVITAGIQCCWRAGRTCGRTIVPWQHLPGAVWRLSRLPPVWSAWATLQCCFFCCHFRYTWFCVICFHLFVNFFIFQRVQEKYYENVYLVKTTTISFCWCYFLVDYEDKIAFDVKKLTQRNSFSNDSLLN